MRTTIISLFFMTIGVVQIHAQELYYKVPNRFSNNMEIIDSTTIMIPLAWSSWAKVDNLKIESSGDFDYRNIFFYNFIKDTTTVLFTDSSQLIALKYKQEFNPTSRNTAKDYFYHGYLLFYVINCDFNKDGKLDTTDPVYLYKSDPDGSDLMLITPENFSVRDINYFEDFGFILATLKEDTNSDGRFNNNDRELVYRIDLNDFSRSKFVEGLHITNGK